MLQLIQMPVTTYLLQHITAYTKAKVKVMAYTEIAYSYKVGLF